MNQKTLELYLYMNSPEPIIEWLKKEKVKTKQQCLDKLQPLVQSNMYAVMLSSGGSLAGTAGCVKRVVEYFEKLENA